MVDRFLLLSGCSIYIPQIKIKLHQPKLKEIAKIGEQYFFMGCELLNFSKNNIVLEDKTDLEDKTNFDIILSIMTDPSHKDNISYQKTRIGGILVLLCICSNYTVTLKGDYILLEDKKTQEQIKLDNDNYEIFLDVVKKMFCLDERKKDIEYKPQGTLGNRIWNKLKKGRKKVEEQKIQQKKLLEDSSVLANDVSILACGKKIPIEYIYKKYTLYQFFDEFKRFQMKMNYDYYVEAKIVGAKGMKEVPHWFVDIRDNEENNT